MTTRSLLVIDTTAFLESINQQEKSYYNAMSVTEKLQVEQFSPRVTK